ncbi:MAG TPA: 2,3-bisphosphoglycerate-independent phosphoglycerate mutase [Longimicrobium sp.]|nr:2,3-bisphosphoglycerate-independent phosphoglycerate mutase [Longimicrobium sp.]
MPDSPPTAAGRPRACFVILDGWGLREPAWDNAVAQARTPTWTHLWEEGGYPKARLVTHGPAVGLPEGQMGNSEVGHTNLGAGRVVMQSLQRITHAIETGELFRVPALLEVMRAVKARGATLHLLGLVGRGGVHAVDAHLMALCDMAAREGVPRVRIHAFLDGRDTPPQSARGYVEWLRDRLPGGDIAFATLTGRYWAMDRDRRWDRVELAYRALVHGEGVPVRDPVQAIAEAYTGGETDEFVKPRVLVDDAGAPLGSLHDGDGAIFFNFRADRARELSRALADPAFDGFDRGPMPNVELVTLTQYDEDFPLPCAFPPEELRDKLCDVLAARGLTSFRTAETEKYPHVTYFFNGGAEEAPPGETRRLVPSPRVATYDLQPEMSAPEVTRGLVEAIRSKAHDVLVCNYANPDMVGHTGSLEAAKKAVEAVDAGLGEVLAACRETGTALLVSADHGNCEQMWDPETNGPHTAHTTNPVGIVLVEPDGRKTAAALDDGALADVAPTLLGLIGVPQPAAMTGKDLRVRG